MISDENFATISGLIEKRKSMAHPNCAFHMCYWHRAPIARAKFEKQCIQ